LELLKESGYTIVFISHKIHEVMAICDRITVLRKGRTVDTISVQGATAESISKMMVGRDVLLNVSKEVKPAGEVDLNVDQLTVYNDMGIKMVDDVSFVLRKNQILGIAGVEGNGQSELADALFGILPVAKGTIFLKGSNITKTSVHLRRKSGLGYIPEDRMVTGAAAGLSIWENLIADKMDQKYLGKFGLLDTKKIAKDTNELLHKFNIIALNAEQSLSMLSGGNMQKVVVARELSSNPDVLIANQPTRGIDVGAQEFIWNELVKFRDDGKSVLLISADLNELLELSDIVMVMLKGKCVAVLDNTEKITEDDLGLYMLGVKSQEKEGDFNEK
jgi:simple sugar transport system ATP-binding protein